MRVADDARADVDAAAAHVDHRVDRHQLFLDGGRRGHHLEGGAGFVEVLDGAVAAGALVRGAIVVRVEGRLVSHRQNLAGLRIHDDRRTAEGTVLCDTLAQFALGDMLQELVDGQFDGSAGRRRLLEAAEGVAPCVGLHQHLAVLAANHRVVRRLEPVQPLAIDADEAEDMRRQFIFRIFAMAFLDEADAGEIERLHLHGDILRHLPAHVGEVTLLLQTLEQFLPLARGAVAECLAQQPDRCGFI